MGRVIVASFHGRKSLPKLLAQLKSKKPSEWSGNLQKALLILSDQMELPDDQAKAVVLASVSAAHRCLAAEQQQIRVNLEHQSRRQIAKSCRRLANCAKRSPRAIRTRLDHKIGRLAGQSIDLETMEIIFVTAGKVFNKFPKHEPARAASKALGKVQEARYSTLDMVSRRNVESAVARLSSSANQKQAPTAAEVFSTIAATLNGTKLPKARTQSAKFVAQYVADVVEIWEQTGIKPTRAQDYADPDYTSHFHRFTEFVLTGIAPTPVPRHNDPPPINVRHSSISKDPAHKWRVQDNDVRAALRSRS